jgi:hypothetical protein
MPAFRAFERSDDVDDQDYSGDRRAPNPTGGLGDDVPAVRTIAVADAGECWCRGL